MLSDVIGEKCDDEEWPQIFMAGMVTMTFDYGGCLAIHFKFIITNFIKRILSHSCCPRGVVTP